MTKIRLTSILFLCGVLLCGCAGRVSGEGTWRGIQAGMEDLTEITERTEYYDIVLEAEDIFYLGIGDEHPGSVLTQTGSAQFSLGTQFYQGEPIKLWAEAREDTSDICLYRTDGSRELLLQGVPTVHTLFDHYIGWNWYLSQEGVFYCWHGANYLISRPELVEDEDKKEGAFAIISASGEIVYEKTFAPGVSIEDFCQLSDGQCFLLLKDEVEQSRTLAELQPSSRRIETVDKVQMLSPLLGNQMLGTVGESLAVFQCEVGKDMEIVEINPADGAQFCLLSFTGTSYVMDHVVNLMQEFRMQEDGNVEILWLESTGSTEGTLEKLRMDRVNKIPVVLRGDFKSDGWIKKCVSDFNQQSGSYHVIIEDCGAGNDMEDFARLTSIQLAAGKGPDILHAGFMQDYIAGMLEKGVLEDLSPYMEKSGVREEDYFPFVFGTWRADGRIYGINPRMSITGYRMDESVLGGREEPDIESLVDALLSWEGSEVFMTGMNSQELLEMLLEGTDTLWGMVDWERESCDFGGGLFAKVLEASKKCGSDGRKGQLSGIAESRIFWDIFRFDSAAERESAGKVICGVLFDDGCHGAVYSAGTMAVNANSSNKEGAWEFLRFLLGEEAQSSGAHQPVSRRGFELWLEKQRERVADGKTVRVKMTTAMPNHEAAQSIVFYTEEDLTEEKIAEYRKALEDAKPYPIHTAPILDIILDESENYFNGSKSAEQVCEILTNRVQLYLDELR